MPIKVLAPEVASQIAAGEVVERPASVVKELLENALDAGASQVAIRVEGAGQRSIEVSDDGKGIPADELALAVLRHATSKLRIAEDLFSIRTLGFRGEALASIGSVSRLTITSRPPDRHVGARLRVEGGLAQPVTPVGAAAGTLVGVEDLFYNLPARLKFLKQPGTERRHIDSLVTRYALAYPQVRFHLHQDGKAVLQTSGNGQRREILASLYGVETARQMLSILAEEPGLHIEGFLSPTSLTRSNRSEISFFVNGRPVQDAALSAALLKGYHTLLMVGRYPLAIVFLDLSPEAVDVNVHPTKAEVRFREPDRIFSGLQSAVRRALLAHTPVPGISPGLGAQIRWGPEAGPGRRDWEPAWDWRTQAGQSEIPATETAGTAAGEATASLVQPDTTLSSAPSERVPILRLVGQVANSYLVAEGPDGLYLIDQHAAHERVLFERFLALPGLYAPAQALLEAVLVELPPASARLLSEQLPLLARLGFQVEPFGPNTFLVRAIPALLANLQPAPALRVLVEDFEEDETPLQAEVEARAIARICKRAAVKAGQGLSAEEGRALLESLEACRSPRTCPHGRPTMIHLSVDLLERQFGRRGPR